jgi:hypothetical protein
VFSAENVFPAVSVAFNPDPCGSPSKSRRRSVKRSVAEVTQRLPVMVARDISLAAKRLDASGLAAS